MIFPHQIPSFVAGQEQSHPKPSGHGSLHTYGEGKSILIPQRLRDSLLLTLEGGPGKNDSWTEHDLRISSKDSEDAQTNMKSVNFPVSCVRKRSRELEKRGKTLSSRKTDNGPDMDIILEWTGRFKLDGFGLCTRFN